MTYVIADIHGNLRRFLSVLDRIGLGGGDTIYVLGDVIDRHPHGIEILRRIMAMPNARMLLGNHEYMMCGAIGVPGDPSAEWYDELLHWYRNGGEVTHRALNELDIDVQREIFAYLDGLPLNIDVTVNGTAYKLVHAAPTEEFARYPDFRDETCFSVWKRYTENEFTPDGYTMVFGHTPTSEYQSDRVLRIWHGKGMIGVDCGSGFPDVAAYGKQGRLACLRLEDGAEFYSDEAGV